MAARNISVPTNNCEIAAACGEAGDRVKAFVSYGDGMAVDYGDRRAQKSYHETSCEYNRPRKGNTIEARPPTFTSELEELSKDPSVTVPLMPGFGSSGEELCAKKFRSWLGMGPTRGIEDRQSDPGRPFFRRDGGGGNGRG